MYEECSNRDGLYYLSEIVPFYLSNSYYLEYMLRNSPPTETYFSKIRGLFPGANLRDQVGHASPIEGFANMPCVINPLSAFWIKFSQPILYFI